MKLILLAQFFSYIYTLINRMQKKNMLASISLFFVGLISMAQGATPPPPGPPPPPGLPIDSGIIFLFVAALVYGIYKVNKISKRLT